MTASHPVTTDRRPAGGTDAPLVSVLHLPGGPLGVIVTPDGVVRAAGFGPLDDLVARWSATRTAIDGGAARVQRSAAGDLPRSVVDAVEQYVGGAGGALDAVPVDQSGGPFFQSVWRAMREVPPGTTVTYAELARRAGRPAAVRAAGSACARNLVAPFVPCHRIVRTDGTMGGYAYGVRVKEQLLEHERCSAG